jgi:hypothetical protein
MHADTASPTLRPMIPFKSHRVAPKWRGSPALYPRLPQAGPGGGGKQGAKKGAKAPIGVAENGLNVLANASTGPERNGPRTHRLSRGGFHGDGLPGRVPESGMCACGRRNGW